MAVRPSVRPHRISRLPVEGFKQINIREFYKKCREIIFFLIYIKNQPDATLAVLFISNCKITLHVSDAFYVHHQEY